jgi:hypothetical protein
MLLIFSLSPFCYKGLNETKFQRCQILRRHQERLDIIDEVNNVLLNAINIGNIVFLI